MKTIHRLSSPEKEYFWARIGPIDDVLNVQDNMHETLNRKGGDMSEYRRLSSYQRDNGDFVVTIGTLKQDHIVFVLPEDEAKLFQSEYYSEYFQKVENEDRKSEKRL